MADLKLVDPQRMVLAFARKGLLFLFNFHPHESYPGMAVPVPVPAADEYTVVLSSDDEAFGGFDRIAHMNYPTKLIDGRICLELYLPARTAVVLRPVPRFSPAPVRKPVGRPKTKPASRRKKRQTKPMIQKNKPV